MQWTEPHRTGDLHRVSSEHVIHSLGTYQRPIPAMLAPASANPNRPRPKLEQLDLPSIRIHPPLHAAKSLRIMRLAVRTAIHDPVFACRVFYLLRTRMYADKHTDVEVDGEGEEGLDVPAVAGC